MAQVTAALVKQLREMTDSPMMECKKALVEADGDIEKAVDILRTMGVAKAVKRAGRDTNEGTIAIYISDDSKTGAILELTCETDFVGTNPKFTGFATALAKVVADNDPSDVEALKACPMAGTTVADELTEMIHVIGENMKIARFQRVAVENGALSSYIHLGGKLADVCVFEFSNPETAQNDEKAIYMAQAAESGKPEAIQERMAIGKLEKYYKEYILTEQVFIKDSSITISELAKKVSKSCGDSIAIKSFVRYNFGE